LKTVLLKAEVPSRDVYVTKSRPIGRLEGVRVSGQGKGSLEEDKEKAGGFGYCNIIKHKSILNRPVLGVGDQQYSVFLNYVVAIDVSLFDHLVVLHISQSSGVGSFETSTNAHDAPGLTVVKQRIWVVGE
jgi:hypothetical protein